MAPGRPTIIALLCLIPVACGSDVPGGMAHEVGQGAESRQRQAGPKPMQGNNELVVASYSGADLEKAPVFRVSQEAKAVFGLHESPPIDLQGVRTVKPLSHGLFAALDQYLPTIYVFDSSGRLLNTLGRSGDGPGEFRTVHSLAVLQGDSLAVIDENAARLTVFGPDGGVRTARMPPGLSTRFSRVLGRLSSGELVLANVPVIRAPREGGRERIHLELAILDFSSEPREILALPDFEVALQPTRFGGSSRMSSTWVRLAARASVRLFDSLIAVTTGDEFLVRLHDRIGRPVREIRVDVPPRRVTEAMREAQIARDLDVLHNVMREPPVHIEESERVIREAPYAEWLPAIGGLVESSEGLLWVLEGQAPTDSTWTALAFELTGTLVRRVQGPADVRPVLFRSHDVVLRTTDQDGLVGFESREYR